MTELDPILEAFAKKLAPLVAAELAQAPGNNPNELLTVPKISQILGISPAKTRILIRGKELRRAPGLSEMRVKRSVVDAYGKEQK